VGSWTGAGGLTGDMMKKCFVDTETCGLSGEKNGLHQIAGMIEVDGKIVEKFNLFARPFEEDFISADALKACSVTLDQIMTYPDPREVHKEFTEILGRHVNKFKKTDKYFLLAYNSPFDHEHLRAFFTKCGDKYFGSFFVMPDICIMRLAAHLMMKERNKLMNFKQQTVAEYLGLVDGEVEWHNALDDVEMAYKIYNKIIGDQNE
jgi:DNA polymerase III subunit epsilon